MNRTLAGIGVLVAALAAAPLASGPDVAQQKGSATAKAPVASVDLNTATASQLEALPGIGPKTAQLIIEYREKNGGFKKIEELMNVKGVGEKTFLRLKDLIAVSPPKARDTARRSP